MGSADDGSCFCNDGRDRECPRHGDEASRRTLAQQVRIPDQAPPTVNDGPRVWDLVIRDVEVGYPHMAPERIAAVVADMRERDALGAKRYGTHLQPHNGRNAIIDAYQEALDMAVYLRQALEENGPKPGEATASLYHMSLFMVIRLRSSLP